MKILNFLFKPNISKLIKEKDVKSLISILESQDDFLLRAKAVEALGIIGDISTIEPLMTTLKDENISVRKGAANSLVKMKWNPSNQEEEINYLIAAQKWDELHNLDSHADELLIEKQKSETNYNIKEYLAEVLLKIGTSRALDSVKIWNLTKTLLEENEQIRNNAILNIFNIANKGYYDALDALVAVSGAIKVRARENDIEFYRPSHFAIATGAQTIKDMSADKKIIKLASKDKLLSDIQDTQRCIVKVMQYNLDINNLSQKVYKAGGDKALHDYQLLTMELQINKIFDNHKSSVY